MAENYVSNKKVKTFIKEAGCMCGKDVSPALNDLIEQTLKEAIEEVKSNKKSVVRGVNITPSFEEEVPNETTKKALEGPATDAPEEEEEVEEEAPEDKGEEAAEEETEE